MEGKQKQWKRNKRKKSIEISDEKKRKREKIQKHDNIQYQKEDINMRNIKSSVHNQGSKYKKSL